MTRISGLWSPYTWLYLGMVGFGLGLGIFVANRQAPVQPVYQQAQMLPAGKTLPGLDLLNQYGEPIAADLWSNQWSLVFFGFTSCPDICPLELQKLGKLLRSLGEGSGVQVVFVTVDPERDTTEKLRDYANFFHPDIVALTGSNTELARTAQFFGAAYDRSVIIEGKLLRVPSGIDMPQNAGDQYQVNHSTRVFIINPKGEYAGSFAPPFEVAQVESDLNVMIRQ